MEHAASASHASVLEWALVLAAVIVLVWSVGLALRYTFWPQELEADHIKRRILVDDIDEAREARRR